MNSAMEGMEDLPEAQRNALLQKIEELQVRDRSVSLADMLQGISALSHRSPDRPDLTSGGDLDQSADIQLSSGALLCGLCQLLPQ